MYSNFTEAIRRKFEEAWLAGETKGKYEGILEGKLEDARKMLAKQLPEDLIMEITNLSREQLDELKAELKNKQ
ncbi:MAG TPA: hypothetical protein PLI94_00630 [Bacillota bacterium]|nr:hypothetical protein [Bacillota bacterium]HPT66528.1 hypothetical protein [Bacillota bacterium]